MLQRLAEDRLARWLDDAHRKPLVIRGARQVGKSTLVRRFAKERGLALHEVNLERHRALARVFETLDVGRITREIEFLSAGGPLDRPRQLLFLDEIQAVPAAVQALRYFHEEHPRLPVVAAGSLLEITLSARRFSVPVGRIEYLYLGPMTMTELLRAQNETELVGTLERYEPGESFPILAHERMLEMQRIFLLVGGMPEAVQRYVDTHSLTKVDDVHASIVETYRDDFAKYATSAELRRLHRVFDHVPLSLGEKVKYVRIDPSEQARDVARALDLLEMAQVITKAHHTDAVGVPLGATVNPRVFKAYFLDCGLVRWLCGIRKLATEDMVRRSFVNEGQLAEQFVAQHLAFLGPDTTRPALTYWLREGLRGNAEVDFVVAVGQSIVPVEVKAGTTGALKSLQQFVAARGVQRAVRFDLNPPGLQTVSHALATATGGRQVTFELLSLPLYMVEQLPRLACAPPRRDVRARSRPPPGTVGR